MKWQREKIVCEYFSMVNMDKMVMRKPEEEQVHLVLTFTNVWLHDIFFVPLLLDYIQDCQHGVRFLKFSL